MKKCDSFGINGHNLGVETHVPSVTLQPDARQNMAVPPVAKTEREECRKLGRDTTEGKSFLTAQVQRQVSQASLPKMLQSHGVPGMKSKYMQVQGEANSMGSSCQRCGMSLAGLPENETVRGQCWSPSDGQVYGLGTAAQVKK